MSRLPITTLADALAKSKWEPSEDSERIGYARVSTEEQNLDMQIAALTKDGIRPEHLFSEQLSAVSKKRPRLQAALACCRPGDVFVVWRLDRVARSLSELLRIMQHLDDTGVGFISLTERVDTTTPIGRLYVHIAGAFAEFERQLIVERTRAGVRRAMERGQRFGAERKIDLDKTERMLRAGKSVAQVAADQGVTKGCVYNWFSGAKLEALRRNGPKRKR